MPSRRELEFALANGVRPLAAAWHRLADGALASLEISNSQGWALVHLARLGPTTRQADLAQAIGITEASLVRILHQLEHAGFVTRQPDRDDRRTNRLMLTESGAVIAAGIDERLVALRTYLLDGVTDEDIALTTRTLDLVARRIAEWRGLP